MKRLRRFYKYLKRSLKKISHRGSTPLDSSIKTAKPTAGSASIVPPAQSNSSLLPAGDILPSTPLVTAYRPPTEVGPDPRPQPDGDPKIQTIASDPEGIEMTAALPGEPLPSSSTQAQLPLQATAGNQFVAAEDASISAPHGSSGSNSSDFEENLPSNPAQPTLPLQIPGGVQLPAGGHADVGVHKGTLGSNSAGLSAANTGGLSRLSPKVTDLNLPALPGEPLPSNTAQACLPLQTSAGGRFAAGEDANIGTPQGTSGSNSMDFEETPLSNSIQPSLPLQTLGEVRPPAGGYIDVVAHESTLGSNLTGKFFENASNFSVNNPIMGENIQITHVQMPDGAILEKMVEHIIPGAQYDSSARDSPPHCHPGTRTQILKDVQARVHSPDLATRMIWIYGPAGVGKSAIMQTLAEAEASQGGIFTTLFFSRPNERDDPKKAFTTLAYSLAVHSLDYQRYVGQRLKGDPMFLAKTLDDQFQQLFVTPFLTPFTKDHIDFSSRRWVMFLDGLDECRGEVEQGRVVELIRKSMLHCAMSTPFIWVIASRPEAHLKMEFAKAKTNVTSFWELEVPIDSVESFRDVEHYLHTQFSKMRESLSDSIPPLWPSESDFLKLSEGSSGLFIFASTLVAYLLGGDPVSRLKYIIPLIMAARTQTVDPKRNPFRVLDLLYTQIMSGVPEEVLSTTKNFLGFYLFSASLQLNPISLLSASNVLNLGQYEAYPALRRLSSVLDFPSSQEAGNRPIRFLHASFSDFLLDPARSQTYFIDLNEEASRLWGYCSDVLRQYETHHTPTCINLSWSPSGADLVALQETVFQAARSILTRTILADNPKLVASEGVLFTDNASLLRALQSLGPSIFRLNQERPQDFVSLLGWLSDRAPFEVRREFYKTSHVRDLNINQFLKSLCAQRWCYHLNSSGHRLDFDFPNVDLSAPAEFGASEWPQAWDALWNGSRVFGELVKDSGFLIEVRQLGFEGTRQCVVIGPIFDLPTGQGISYYVFPYFDEQADS